MSYRLINDLDVNVFNFKKFGKELPKSHKLSPHSFIQVALQLAYYRSGNAQFHILMEMGNCNFFFKSASSMY